MLDSICKNALLFTDSVRQSFIICFPKVILHRMVHASLDSWFFCSFYVEWLRLKNCETMWVCFCVLTKHCAGHKFPLGQFKSNSLQNHVWNGIIIIADAAAFVVQINWNFIVIYHSFFSTILSPSLSCALDSFGDVPWFRWLARGGTIGLVFELSILKQTNFLLLSNCCWLVGFAEEKSAYEMNSLFGIVCALVAVPLVFKQDCKLISHSFCIVCDGNVYSLFFRAHWNQRKKTRETTKQKTTNDEAIQCRDRDEQTTNEK